MNISLFRSIAVLSIFCVLSSSCQSQTTEKNLSEESIPQSDSGKKKSILLELKEHSNLPIDERIALYYQLKEENPQGYDFDNEDDLNMYGYTVLWENQVTDAIEIFKMIVAEFPESSNAYDSLGEAYLANGDSSLSLVNYQKSLDLNPDNFGAEDKIEAIKFPDRKPPSPYELFVKVYAEDAYKADLDQLGNTLVEFHPAVFKFISEKDFWQNIEDQKARITSETTFAEFSWMCSDIVASVDCSHTSSGRFYPEHQMIPMDLRFPAQTRLVDGKLYVIDPLNNSDKLSVKDEIVSINGMSISDLTQSVYKHISSQGSIETTKRHIFNMWSTGMIPYALGFPEEYSVVLAASPTPIALSNAETTHDPMPDPSIDRCKEELCLDFIDHKTAVMTIASFNYYVWNRFEIFQKFMDESFAELNRKGTKNLIIDLRQNGGGSPESAVYLLRYLSEKPFTYYSESGYPVKETQMEVSPFENGFNGKCYFLIDGMGNSTTGHFMSMVELLDLGTIVGEELGSNQFCTGGQKISRLTNTKLLYYVADNNNKTTATHLPDEVGILPDYEVHQSIDEYLNHVDAVKDFTFEVIEKNED